MDTQAELCGFFSRSPKRQDKLVTVIESDEESEVRRRKLHSLSRTRWVER